MQVGILSDTHDELTRIKQALALFQDHSVQILLHGGDFTETAAVSGVMNAGLPTFAVYGNCDAMIRNVAFGGNLQLLEGPATFTIPGTDFTVCMAHEPWNVLPCIPEGTTLAIHGHTHQVDLQTPDDGTWILNPGECCGHRSGRATVAVWDTDEHSIVIHDL